MKPILSFLIRPLALPMIWVLLSGAAHAQAAQAAPQMTPRVEIEDLVNGEGIAVTQHSGVRVHYVGKLADGTTFESTMTRTAPFSFRVGEGRVIPGMEQGVLGMRPGGQRRVTIPPELAYGEKGALPKIPPNATLVFDIMLVSVVPRRYKNVDVAGLRQLIAEGAKVIDLRWEDEWRVTGSIAGSHRINAITAKGKLNIRFLAWLKKIAGPDEAVVLVDWDGVLATRMADMISNYGGYTKVHNFKPGLKAWIQSGGQLVRAK